jgi:AhpD family alkylhydroperoxidase
MTTFRKRVLTPRNLPGVTLAAARSLPVLARALRDPATSGQLREEVMLAVTSVNDCRYCSWAHTGLALAEGVDLDALRGLLENGRSQGLGEGAARAILFAQEFAATERQPQTGAREALRPWFSEREIDEILAYIHAIYLANLSGNTVDALLARLRGDEVEGSYLPIELATAVIAGAPLYAIRRASRRPGQRALEAL